jgi:hypothetical protein
VREICICCAAADEPLGRTLAAYLELQLDARVTLAGVAPWLDLLESVETVLHADFVLPVLSADSIPVRVPRERWDAFTQAHVAWLLAGDCAFPSILQRRPFFDLRSHTLNGFRALRRWILNGEIVMEDDLPRFLDEAGIFEAEDPMQVSAAKAYFESVLEIDTRRRTLPSIAAELSHQLGYGRGDDRETMIENVCHGVRTARRLVSVTGPNPRMPDSAGLSSIVCVPGPEPAGTGPEQMLELLAGCRKGRAEPPTYAELDRCLASAFAHAEWPLTRALATEAYAWLKDEYRLAEAYDLLVSLRGAAQYHGDLDSMNYAITQQSWIGEQWSRNAVAHDPPETLQLTFGW